MQTEKCKQGTQWGLPKIKKKKIYIAIANAWIITKKCQSYKQHFLFLTYPIGPWCNMQQALERRKNWLKKMLRRIYLAISS